MKKALLLLMGSLSSFLVSLKPTLSHFEDNLENLFDNVHRKVSEGLEHLDEALDAIGATGNYEEGNFENIENEFFENVENLQKRGHNRRTAGQMADQSMSRKYGKNWTNTKHNMNKRSAGLVQATGKNAKMKAQFNLVITRTNVSGGAAIAQNLPFVLFASAHLVSNYSQLIQKYIPNGVTLTSVTANANGVTFLYTDGTHVDSILITCNEIPYSTFLQECITDVVSIYKNRYTITNTSYQDNFLNTYAISKKTMFGAFHEEQLTIQSYKEPSQFQNGIIDIDADVYADKDRALIHLLIPSPTGASYSVQMSMFVSAYDRYGASKSFGN
jgi:hypothetical protein